MDKNSNEFLHKEVRRLMKEKGVSFPGLAELVCDPEQDGDRSPQELGERIKKQLQRSTTPDERLIHYINVLHSVGNGPQRVQTYAGGLLPADVRRTLVRVSLEIDMTLDCEE